MHHDGDPNSPVLSADMCFVEDDSEDLNALALDALSAEAAANEAAVAKKKADAIAAEEGKVEEAHEPPLSPRGSLMHHDGDPNSPVLSADMCFVEDDSEDLNALALDA